MKVIEPRSYIYRWNIAGPPRQGLYDLEYYARICTRTTDRMPPLEKWMETQDGSFMEGLIDREGNISVMEHCFATAIFEVDRGISHEIVRHRLASFSQESTRYVRYGGAKGDLRFIRPPWAKADTEAGNAWYHSMESAENNYLYLLSIGCRPEDARAVLPTSTATVLAMTTNFREWRHFFNLRTALNAHPQMRQVTVPLLKEFRNVFPELFSDVGCDTP